VDADPALVEELVAANRILFRQGVVDGFGHVSVRDGRRGDRFLLARSMAPALVTAADVMTFDLAGEPVLPAGSAVYAERFIHSEIYRARADVHAVVHSHSPAVIPFGVVSSAPLRAIYHMGGFLGRSVPIFDIRSAAGPVVLMRGHGATAVAGDLRQAVYRAIYTEMNARLQMEAMRLGPVVYLSDEEAENAAATNARQVDRAWELWKMAACGAGPVAGREVP
jgi:HCOMODA/2-hydroxy-3-carboxy-muconic semialdehyde decarboxylase